MYEKHWKVLLSYQKIIHCLPYYATCIPSMHSMQCSIYEHFCFQSFLDWSMYSWHINSWIILRITISLYYQRFMPPSFMFSFLNNTLLEYPGRTNTFQRFTYNIKTVKHFRRNSYPIPSYLVPHRHEHFLYRLWLLAPHLILPHQ